MNCNYYINNICRSCNLIESSYDEQLLIKENSLIELVKNNLFLDVKLLDTVKSAQSGFRNKVKVSVAGSVDDPVIGLVSHKNNFEGSELLECPIHSSGLNEILKYLVKIIKKYSLVPYDVSSKTGELKGIILVKSESSNDVILRFILRSREAEGRIKKAVAEIQNEFSNIKVISINIQPIPHAILEGDTEIILSETESIISRLKDVDLCVTPKSFYQTNTKMAEELYDYVRHYLKEYRVNEAWDLCCGVGGFSMFISDIANKVIGIEISEESIKSANISKEINNRGNVEFFAMDIRDFVNDVSNNGSNIAEVAVINPPRGGLAQIVVEALQKMKISKIVYSSCNAKTLVRDLVNLNNLYEIESMKIFDMFPNSSHYEVVTILNLKE